MRALSSILLLISITTPVFADADEDLENYIKECNAPAELYDAEIMAKTIADPAKFMQFITTINNPATTKTMMECISSPEQWQTVTNSIMDINKTTNAMTLFMNPEMYMNWLTASMNPHTFQPFFAYVKPSFYMQWLSAFSNPTFYVPMVNMMNLSGVSNAFETFYSSEYIPQNTIRN